MTVKQKVVKKTEGEGQENSASSLLSIDDLIKLRDSIEKESGSKLFWGNDKKFELKLLPLNIPTFDNILDGGLPFDRAIMVYGEASAGKTLLAMLAMASAQKQGVSCAYIDVERVWVPEWAEILGIDSSKVLVSRPKSGEDVWKIMMTLVKHKVGVIVLDSIAAIASSKSLDKDIDEMFDKPQVMANASLNQEGLKNVIAINEGSLIILINQLRLTPTMYGNPESIPGGKNLGFASWLKIRVKRGEWIEEGTGDSKTKIGYMLRIIVEKNKQGKPFVEAEVPFMFSGKIDYVYSMVQDAIERQIVIKNGPYYSYKDMKILGKVGFINKIKEDSDLEEQLKQDLAADIEEIDLE